MREVSLHKDTGSVFLNLNDHTGNSIYAYYKRNRVYHAAMYRSRYPSQGCEFFFVDAFGALDDSRYPGESEKSYQSEIDLIMDKMRQGNTIYEFQDEKEFREWAAIIEKEIKIYEDLSVKAW